MYNQLITYYLPVTLMVQVLGCFMPTSLYLTAHQPAKRARLLDLASSHIGLD